MDEHVFRVLYACILTASAILQIVALRLYFITARVSDNAMRNIGISLAFLGDVAVAVSHATQGRVAFAGTVGALLLPAAAVGLLTTTQAKARQDARVIEVDRSNVNRQKQT